LFAFGHIGLMSDVATQGLRNSVNPIIPSLTTDAPTKELIVVWCFLTPHVEKRTKRHNKK
jgi:hypothetical protein